MSERHDLRDDLAVYALGALDERESDAIETHLGECPTCSQYLRGLWPAVDALAASVPQVAPPTELRGRLVATVRSEAERIAAAEGASAGPRRRPGWRALIARPATALAAGAILVAGAAIGYVMHGEGSASRSVVPVHPMAGAGPGTLAATLEQVDGEGMLRVRHLPPLRPDHVYEVWTERAGRMRPASTFVPRRDGSAMAAVPHVDDATAVFVTQEPRGGSAHPTSPPLMRASPG